MPLLFFCLQADRKVCETCAKNRIIAPIFILYTVDFLQSVSNSWFLLLLLGIMWLTQLAYYLFVYARGAFGGKKNETLTIEMPFSVSVVLVARNAEDYLATHLPPFLEQDFPVPYEVVVVNDCSTDATEDILRALSSRYAHLKVTYIRKDEKFTTNKKLALTVGIKAASNDWVLFSELDCAPVGKRWLATMQSYFTPRNELVLGVQSFPAGKSFGNRWFRHNHMMWILGYLGMAMAQRPYLALSRNLAYRKSLFFEHKGFAGNVLTDYGEDDLFVQQAAKNNVTYVNLDPDARVICPIPSTAGGIRSFYHKYRLSARKYPLSTKLFLLGEPLSRVLFCALALVTALLDGLWPVALAMVAIRWIVQAIVLFRAGKQLKEPGLWPLAWFFDTAGIISDLQRTLSVFLRPVR